MYLLLFVVINICIKRFTYCQHTTK